VHMLCQAVNTPNSTTGRASHLKRVRKSLGAARRKLGGAGDDTIFPELSRKAPRMGMPPSITVGHSIGI